MNFLYAIYNFMKYGVRHTLAEIQFFSYYLFKTSGIFVASFEINVSQYTLSICLGEINPFRFCIFLRFSRNNKKWS